jgi:ribosomal-protein-alanine N-acetyltransferase
MGGEATLGSRSKRAVDLRAPSSRFESEFLAASRRSRRLHGSFARPPSNPRQFRAFLRRMRSAEHAGHLVVERKTGTLVGVVNLNDIVRGSFQSADLGYYAFSPFAGQGYMTAGLSAVLRRAFGELSLHRVEANIQPDNRDSIRLARRLGFQKEGLSPRYLKVGGRWRDHERWALLAEQWRPSRVSAP